MKNKLHVFAILVLFFSCSKEKKIENKLTRGKGEWNIVSTYLVSDGDGNEELFKNGTFIFDDSGTGEINAFSNYKSINGAFTFSNTSNELTIVYLNGKVEKYQMTLFKNKIQLDYYNTSPEDLYDYKEKHFVLEKAPGPIKKFFN